MVARGVSPWNANGRGTKPQRGDRKLKAGAEVRPNTTVQVWRICGGALPMLVGVCRPAGALLLDGAVVQGLTPLATDRRPFGTCIWHPKQCSLVLKYRSASLPTDPGAPGTGRSAATTPSRRFKRGDALAGN